MQASQDERKRRKIREAIEHADELSDALRLTGDLEADIDLAAGYLWNSPASRVTMIGTLAASLVLLRLEREKRRKV